LFKLCSTTTPNGIATVPYFFGTIPQRFAFSLPQLRELRLQKSIEIFKGSNIVFKILVFHTTGLCFSSQICLTFV